MRTDRELLRMSYVNYCCQLSNPAGVAPLNRGDCSFGAYAEEDLMVRRKKRKRLVRERGPSPG